MAGSSVSWPTLRHGTRVLDPTPLRRLATVDVVASAALFLAGPASSMTTGHTLPVDGGFSAV